MCGIAGALLPNAALPAPEIEARLWRMIATIRHRGPDDEGVWTDGLCGLGHARLSIIDLSPAGHQPIASADGMVWLTYNGEIYNFTAIRHQLSALGYVFRSRTDSEVIANGWHAWGPALFSRLRGMFALALWDRRSRRLILARDRLGKKPLYYTPNVYRRAARRFCSAPRSRPCSPGPVWRAFRTSMRSTAISACNTYRRRKPRSPGSANCPPRIT
jgi:asparagine synthase (glutamine-hydrolysing)